MTSGTVLIILMTFFSIGCEEKDPHKIDPYVRIPLEVTATAYNALEYQTSENPHITARGDTLIPGMKSIAVSSGLFAKGLIYGTLVRIDTFADTFHINDKMHPSSTNRIDIYFGENIIKAKQWGRKKVIIEYAVKKKGSDSLTLSLQNPKR